ncbi:MAG TPA: hypothetical protein VHX38_21245 [Pseudonocardiaceae bacterium]|jgi:hypothetical protein|nr:hypothetical protein [Pseudonocardiaceae bacterium]
MAYVPAQPSKDWRSWLLSRLVAATVIGALTGGAALLAGHLMPTKPIAVVCKPAGELGCAIGAPITGFLLGVLLLLAVVAATALVVGVALSGLSAWLVGVRLGITAPLVWPAMLWTIAVLLQPTGATMLLSGPAVLGYVALAFVLTATLTAPQIPLTARLMTTGLLILVVILIRVFH